MLYDEGTLDVVSVDGAVGYQGGMHAHETGHLGPRIGFGSGMAQRLGAFTWEEGCCWLAGDRVTLEYCWMAVV